MFILLDRSFLHAILEIPSSAWNTNIFGPQHLDQDPDRINILLFGPLITSSRLAHCTGSTFCGTSVSYTSFRTIELFKCMSKYKLFIWIGWKHKLLFPIQLERHNLFNCMENIWASLNIYHFWRQVVIQTIRYLLTIIMKHTPQLWRRFKYIYVFSGCFMWTDIL